MLLVLINYIALTTLVSARIEILLDSFLYCFSDIGKKFLRYKYTKVKFFNLVTSFGYLLQLLLIFFHNCEVALTSQVCFPIGLVFHQHLNSHIAYPGSPPEPSNHTRWQFLHLPSFPLFRLLWSKSNYKVTRKRIFDQYHTGTPLSSTALR